MSSLLFQALAENLVIGFFAAVVGVLFAWLGAVALRNWSAGAMPRAESIQLDIKVLLFALAASLGCALIAGLLPALQLSVSGPGEALREAGPRTSESRSSSACTRAWLWLRLDSRSFCCPALDF